MVHNFRFVCLMTAVWTAVLCMTALSGYAADSIHAADLKKSTYADAPSDKRLAGYMKKIETLENRIAFFADELDWLELKIQHITDSDRHVPKVLKKSADLKKAKIKRLSNQKQRLEKYVQSVPEDVDSGKPTTLYKRTDKEPAGSIGNKNTANAGKEALLNRMNRYDLNQWVQVTEAGTRLKMNTTLPILFPSGSAEIAEEYKTFFKRLARFLETYDVWIMVNGYTDPVPINTEQYPTNFELGAARAANVVHELVKNGMKPSIFRIGSTAEHRFQAAGRSGMKSMERKAEITVIFTG